MLSHACGCVFIYNHFSSAQIVSVSIYVRGFVTVLRRYIGRNMWLYYDSLIFFFLVSPPVALSFKQIATTYLPLVLYWNVLNRKMFHQPFEVGERILLLFSLY
jgi:hypothetical protein